MNLTDVLIGVLIVGGAYYLYTRNSAVQDIVTGIPKAITGFDHGDYIPGRDPISLNCPDKKCPSGQHVSWNEATKSCGCITLPPVTACYSLDPAFNAVGLKLATKCAAGETTRPRAGYKPDCCKVIAGRARMRLSVS